MPSDLARNDQLSERVVGRRSGSLRRTFVHALRLLMLAGIVACIHLQHRKLERELPRVERTSAGGTKGLANASSVQTSPQSDHIIGFSGPTNLLIGFEDDGRIAQVEILSSGDTRDHVQQVQDHPEFLAAYQQKTWQEAADLQPDAVSGATLTSYAMVESISNRLGGTQPSLRFPDPPEQRIVDQLFHDFDGPFSWRSESGSRYVVSSEQGPIGSMLASSPAADQEIGYQGPTRTWVGMDSHRKITGIVVGDSFDNLPYTDYVREDAYFCSLFNGLTLQELSELNFEQYDPEKLNVEGVSGATMTSMAVAYGIQAAASDSLRAKAMPDPSRSYLLWSWKEAVTIGVVLLAIVFAFTDLRGNRWLRIAFQIIIIGWLGFANGALISQVMLVGWAQNTVPWRSAIGLVVLTFAAFVIPITTKNNIYCNHLCPHGAIQQLIKKRVRWQWKLSSRTSMLLSMIPGLLLLLIAVVALFRLPINLVDVEPFDAYLFRIAGWSSIVIAVVGLVASLFVPMAYCRFGCPTGALIGYTRFHARADRIGPRDWLAGAVLAVSLFALL